MKKKILIITPWFPSPAHPTEGIFVWEQSLILSKEYDVHVLALVLTDWKEITHRPQKQAGFPEREDITATIRRFYTLPGMRFFYPLYLYFYSLKLGGIFDEIVSTWGRPDIIHAHIVLPAGGAALKLGKKHKIPVVLTEHTEPFSLHLRTPAYRRLTRQTLLGVSKIIAVSPSLKKQVSGFEPGTSIEVVGNVTDETFFVPTPFTQKAEPTFRFLTVGLLTERKGISHLIKAVRLLSRETHQRFEVIICGDGPIRPALERQAEEADVRNYCKFTGESTRVEVRDWLNCSDAFVLPSLGETFGIVVLEAMMCGKPIISTRCGGPEDLVTPETGVLVEVADPSALAKAMLDFMEGRHIFNPDSVRKSAVERYGREAFLRQIAKIYAAL